MLEGDPVSHEMADAADARGLQETTPTSCPMSWTTPSSTWRTWQRARPTLDPCSVAARHSQPKVPEGDPPTRQVRSPKPRPPGGRTSEEVSSSGSAKPKKPGAKQDEGPPGLVPKAPSPSSSTTTTTDDTGPKAAGQSAANRSGRQHFLRKP